MLKNLTILFLILIFSGGTAQAGGQLLTPKLPAYEYTDAEITESLATVADTYQPFCGFENRDNSTIAVSGTGVFSLTVESGSTSFDVWTNNTRHTITTTQTATIANEGETYLYIDADGALQQSATVWDILNTSIAPCAIVFKQGENWFLTDERHGYQRNLSWHKSQHMTVGALYGHGLGGTFADTTMSIATGSIYDEDLYYPITGPVTTALSWYRTAGGSMQHDGGVTAAKMLTDGSLLAWDNAGTLAAITNNDFAVYWVYATNNVDYPIFVVCGQADYATAAAARNATKPIIGLSTSEWKLIYKTIYQRTSGLPAGDFIEAADFRGVSTGLPSLGVTPGDHNALVNRDAVNSHPIAAITDGVSTSDIANMAETDVAETITEKWTFSGGVEITDMTIDYETEPKTESQYSVYSIRGMPVTQIGTYVYPLEFQSAVNTDISATLQTAMGIAAGKWQASVLGMAMPYTTAILTQDYTEASYLTDDDIISGHMIDRSYKPVYSTLFFPNELGSMDWDDPASPILGWSEWFSTVITSGTTSPQIIHAGTDDYLYVVRAEDSGGLTGVTAVVYPMYSGTTPLTSITMIWTADHVSTGTPNTSNIARVGIIPDVSEAYVNFANFGMTPSRASKESIMVTKATNGANGTYPVTSTSETQSVPAAAGPYIITLAGGHPAPIVITSIMAGATEITAGDPATEANQYSISGNDITFNAAQAEVSMVISYTYPTVMATTKNTYMVEIASSGVWVLYYLNGATKTELFDSADDIGGWGAGYYSLPALNAAGWKIDGTNYKYNFTVGARATVAGTTTGIELYKLALFWR